MFNIPQIISHEMPPKAKKKQSVVQNVKGGKRNVIYNFSVDNCNDDYIDFQLGPT